MVWHPWSITYYLRNHGQMIEIFHITVFLSEKYYLHREVEYSVNISFSKIIIEASLLDIEGPSFMMILTMMEEEEVDAEKGGGWRI